VSDKFRNGLHVKDFHLPWTKVTREKGEHVYWSQQDGVVDPCRAFPAHIAFNNPPPEGAHLFSYPNGTNKDGHTVFEPMRWGPFLARLNTVCTKLSKAAPDSHSIRISSIFEYLMRGTEFAVSKVMGCWGSDAFEGYLWDHALILVPHLQARLHTEKAVARMAIPS
jgi:hypothetical protein